jgi:hypothetical protein
MHLSDATRLREAFVCPHHGAVSVAPDDREPACGLCPLCTEEALHERPGLEADVPELEHSELHFRELEERPI